MQKKRHIILLWLVYMAVTLPTSSFSAFTSLIPRQATLKSPNLITNSKSARCYEYAKVDLLKPRWGGPIIGTGIRFFNNIAVGFIFTFILRVMNKLEVFGRKELLKHVLYRPKGKGLLTISNHQSVADDPGIWAALLPWWRIPPWKIRWALCTEDVFFYKPWLTSVLGGGNVMPLDRKGSIDQPLLLRFKEKLQSGEWCHIFPEGRVWQNWRFTENEAHIGKFKAGVGKLIAHSYPNDPVVLPLYHHGMDTIIPEKILSSTEGDKPSVPRAFTPQSGNQIEVFIGEPMNFHDKIQQFDSQYPGELKDWRTTLPKIKLYREITEDIRQQVLQLEAKAYRRQQPILTPRKPRKISNNVSQQK